MAGIRLSGLASGIDTETMIKQLMQAERAPVDRLSQKKQTLTWQRDAYREMNRGLLDLRTAASDMLLSKNYTSKTAASSDASKVSVSASPAATAGSVTIDKIGQLASAASVTMTTTAGNSSDTTLTASGMFTVTDGKINVQINSFSANGTAISETISLDSTQKLSDLTSAINDKASLGMSAVYNDITGKLVLTKTSTGKLNPNLNAPDITILDANVGMEKVNSRVNGSGQDGVNAKYTIGGQELEQKTNTFTQNGLTITLNGTSTTATTINTKLDTQANFDSIKKFVDKYNEMIDKMNKKVREEKYRDFQPLTDAQRKELSEDEVKKWEEKAISGVLKNDSFLRDGMNSFRSAISAKIDTGYSYTADSKTIELNYMSQIGITSTSDFRDGGKLKLDETKLKKMLEEQPEGVYKLFTADAPEPVKNPDGSITPNPGGLDGFVRQIQGFATAMRDKISKVAGLDGAVATTYRLGKSLADVDKSMLTWEDKLTVKENAYYRRFAAMEQAMNQANSQSATLASYLGQ
ncbi:flagellar filament capping protein FliD [Exiguobacterium antarcticum]|uniref:flagellar filament capping protein FliD n=1 Tax=Exiguobacterium antarcticum TaxID=132920 RepID=UPI000285E81D|nr:flagellar filament capping protein FliD [Exiguobacterium antarcticum]AFS71380.1 Flagellar hook-associated 2 domain protein [Exiguobacterium antarcticum B7]